MLHPCLPQMLTPENLAKWITDNSKHSFQHEEKIPLSEKEIQEFEHKSSAASRALDRLKDVSDLFKHYIKKGTLVIDGKTHPQDITIPATKGTEALEANREHADTILEQGYQTVNTALYTIPYPERSQMVVVTIEGQEWPMYTKPMAPDQKTMYGELFAGVEGPKQKNRKKNPLDPDLIKVRGDSDGNLDQETLDL